MLHEPAQKAKYDPASPYKTRLGLWMFLVYCIVYIGFVAINIIAPKMMESVVGSGLNLAVVYGMGLIIFAMILAVLYNSMCTKKEKELAAKNEEVAK